MKSQHCAERSYADLQASGGLPEAQKRYITIVCEVPEKFVKVLEVSVRCADGPDAVWGEWAKICGVLPGDLSAKVKGIHETCLEHRGEAIRRADFHAAANNRFRDTAGRIAGELEKMANELRNAGVPTRDA